jgi:hypothetical protein
MDFNEDYFNQLIDACHGVRVHTVDKPYSCPEAPEVRMITEVELFDDYWTQMIERPHEELCPLEAGPWEDESYDEYGDEVGVGFEIACSPEESYPDEWEVIEEGHYAEQRMMWGLEAGVDKSLSIEINQEEKQKREMRFLAILTWARVASVRCIKRHINRFWKKVYGSRRACAKNKSWQYVYLTKRQVNDIMKVVNAKLGK